MAVDNFRVRVSELIGPVFVENMMFGRNLAFLL